MGPFSEEVEPFSGEVEPFSGEVEIFSEEMIVFCDEVHVFSSGAWHDNSSICRLRQSSMSGVEFVSIC